MHTEKPLNPANARHKQFRSIGKEKYNIKPDNIRLDKVFMLAMLQNCFYVCTTHGHQKFSPSHIKSITKRFVIQKNCCNVTNFACH